MTTQTSARSSLRSRPARLTLGCWALLAALGLLAGCSEEDLVPDLGDATETGDEAPMADTTDDGEDEGEIDETIADLPSGGDEIDILPEVCVPVGELCSPDADACCEGSCQANEVEWKCVVG
jgi:hypothetical protein